MQFDKHPNYREVLFEDSATGTKFIIGSTLETKETTTYEGKEYPHYKVPVSSASHPFFTKSSQFIDAEGRVDKFTKKYQRKSEEAKKAQEISQVKKAEKKKKK